MITIKKYSAVLCLFGVLIAMGVPAQARTKLVALPNRDVIRLNLDHPSESLVTEERVLDLQQGNNHVDFSWQGVQIDPSTIQLQALDHPGTVKLINIAYPPGENALVWNLYAPTAGQERVRIYYLLGGLERVVSYRQLASADEKTAHLDCRYRLANRSGEDLSDVRVNVGIGSPWTTDLRDGEAREMALFDAALPVKKMYIYTVPSDREQSPLFYRIVNDTESGLGNFKLPSGKMRIFQTDSKGSSVFLGEDWMPELPVKEKADLALGMARDVVVKRNVVQIENENIRRSQDGSRIVLADRKVHVRYEIENFKNASVTLKIVEPMKDNWTVDKLTGGAKAVWERKDNATLEESIDLPPKGEKQTVDLYYTQKNQLQAEAPVL
jgi:hypothetical protein